MHNVKKKLNSVLSLFLLITLLCAPLTGCSGSQDTNDSQNPTQTETESNVESESDSESEQGSSSETESGTEATTGSETDKPTGDTQNPDGNTEKPSESTQKPSGSTENPGSSTQEPVDNPQQPDNNTGNNGTDLNTPGISLSEIPAYTTKDYITLNNGIPHFATTNLGTTSYEYYSELDSLGRCGVAYACLGQDLMPTGDRGSISSIKPTGWHSTNYSCVPGSSLYNRSHLIAWSLAGENANKLNLITGTEHLNQKVMTKFEDQVRDYIKETGKHVLYRVTPFFEGNNLVATGVQMEAWSIEDKGESICFNVFIYNIQDGIIIDYATGESREVNPSSGGSTDNPDNSGSADNPDTSGYQFMVNKSNGKIHKITCSSVTSTSEANRVFFYTYEEAEAYSLSIKPGADKINCGTCHAYEENHK